MQLVIFIVLAFVAMEGVAWLAHKYVMHGFLWSLHKDHHKKEDQESFIEHNDFFFVIFAIPGIAGLGYGSFWDVDWALGVGIGITLYGICYFLVHDVFIHQRIKWFRNSKSWYLRGIRRAHKMHHKHLGKEDGECFGMLFVPFKFLFNEMKKNE